MTGRPSKRKLSNRQERLDQAALGPVEQVPIGDLKPYPGNARTHNDKQIAVIAKSLQAFGWLCQPKCTGW